MIQPHRSLAGLILLAAVVLLMPASGWAELSCRAEVNRTEVATGEIVILTVTAEGSVDWSAEFHLPEMPDVQISGGGTNQSMSFTNGKRSSSVAKTYYLKVDGGDDFTIRPVRVVSAGNECLTEPIRIRVSASASRNAVPPQNSGNRAVRPRSNPSGSGAPGAESSAGVSSSGGKPGDDVFVTLEADRTDLWVGQQVLLRFRYYRRIQPWNNPKYTAPRTEGFWREDLGPETNTREMVAGRAYNVTEIRYAIFPAHAGELTVGPAELQFPDDVFDRFFSSRRHQGPRVLRTDPVTLRVKDLPSPAPEGFSGLVADRLGLIAEVDRDTVPRGEPIGLRVQLESDAFLKGFKGFEVAEPADSRLHDAGEQFISAPNRNRLIGTMVVEKVIVPSSEGSFTVPPVELSWFDASRGQYRVARTRAHTLDVIASDLPYASDDDSGFLRNEIARLGQDLAFIHRGSDKLRRDSAPWLQRPLWWTLLALPLIGLAGWRIRLSRLSSDRSDPAGRRRRRALSVARKGLKTAFGIESAVDRMDALARVIAAFVADCTGVPSAAIGAQEVRSFCADSGQPDHADSLLAVLEAADSIRYGRGGDDSANPTADQLEKILTELYPTRSHRTGTDRTGPLAIGLAIVLTAGALTSQAFCQPAETPGVDPARLLAEGNQAYTEGDLDVALSRYEQARDLGADDADLHFNLGNTYARNGELGLAVASYLRAKRLAPRDADVRANLSWVRGHIEDLELDTGQLPLFIAQFAALVAALSLNEWSWVLLLLVWALAGSLAWAWYREDYGTHLRRTLLGLAAAVAVTVMIAGWRYHLEQVRREAVVVIPVAAVRSGPAESFPVLFEVHDGLTLRIESERDDWFRVGLGGDWVGWIPAAGLQEVRLSVVPESASGDAETQGR